MTAPVDLTPQKPRDTRPPNKPSKPASPPKQPTTPTKPDTGRLAAELDTADLLLRTIGVLRLPGLDPADRMRLDHGLRIAQRAVAAAQSPARRDRLVSIPAETSAIATSGGPVQTTQMVLGEEPTPGSGIAVAAAVTGSAVAVVAGSAGDISGRTALGAARPVGLRAGRPPLPGAGFDLPKAPGTKALMASLSRRAD